MLIYTFESLSVITVQDHKALRQVWKMHGGLESLVGTFIVRKPLTAAQYRRLPQDLKNRLRQGDENDAVAFLEQLYRLPDTRDLEGN